MRHDCITLRSCYDHVKDEVAGEEDRLITICYDYHVLIASMVAFLLLRIHSTWHDVYVLATTRIFEASRRVRFQNVLCLEVRDHTAY